MSITRRSFLGALSGFVCFGCQAVCPNPDETFDLIVVGSGVAGLTTAVIAAESGIRRVVVLEKQPLLGGTSIICEGNWSISETIFQKYAGIIDSNDSFYEDMLIAGRRTNKPELVRAMIDAGRQQFEWTVAGGVRPTAVGVNSGLRIPRSQI